MTFVIGLALFALLIVFIGWLFLRSTLRSPSRHYEGPESVASVYDGWSGDRIMEYYWGEHLHAGYYGNPPVKKDFIQAKVDFIDEMIEWGVAQVNPALIKRLENPGQFPDEKPVRILDVGCGIGGSVRHLAKRWSKTAFVTGITISKVQMERAAALSHAQGVDNGIVLACDALKMGFADNSFDIIYAIESEMHMPDKQLFVQEMTRVLRSPDPDSGRPGGVLVLACWNVRDTSDVPLSKDEAAHIRLLVDEWRHAEFTSIPDYLEIFKKSRLTSIVADDWTVQTQPSWRQAVWASASNPGRIMNISMKRRWGLMRDAYTTLRFDEAFRKGLCEYGLIRAQKAA